MVPLRSPKEYLFNLYTLSKNDAKRIWRNDIKEQWNNKCAYCGSEEQLTLDHIIPQSKGGKDTTKNVVSCCHSCNHSKGHTPWEEWYRQQEFFSDETREKILNWIKPDPPTNLYTYRRTKRQYLD